MMRGIVDLGGNLLARIPGLEADCEVLRLHNVHAVPVVGPLPLESAVLRVATRTTASKPAARLRRRGRLLRSRDPMYDSGVLDVLEAYGPRASSTSSSAPSV